MAHRPAKPGTIARSAQKLGTAKVASMSTATWTYDGENVIRPSQVEQLTAAHRHQERKLCSPWPGAHTRTWLFTIQPTPPKRNSAALPTQRNQLATLCRGPDREAQWPANLLPTNASHAVLSTGHACHSAVATQPKYTCLPLCRHLATEKHRQSARPETGQQ